MTSKDIEKLTIVAHVNDGNYIMAVSEHQALIDLVVALCKFVKVDKDLFETYSLSELEFEEGEENNSNESTTAS